MKTIQFPQNRTKMDDRVKYTVRHIPMSGQFIYKKTTIHEKKGIKKGEKNIALNYTIFFSKLLNHLLKWNKV